MAKDGGSNLGNPKLRIVVDRGDIIITQPGTTWVAVALVEEGLKLMDADKKKVVFFKADRELPYAEVYPVLIAVHESGSGGVELGTNDTKE